MRRITVSVLAILIGLPAFATTRLPVVNLGAAGVSARAAFGESTPTHTPKIVASSVAPANVAATAAAKPTRTVVARSATGTPAAAKPATTKQTQTVAKTTPSVDVGEKIAAAGTDVLVPHRPNADLWAKSDAPLRMPMPSEISVVRADFDLPEESLDIKPHVASEPKFATADVAQSHSTTSALDAEINRLVELQRRADASTRTIAATTPTTTARTATTVSAPAVSQRAPIVTESKNTVVARNDATHADDGITVRRMVVPMDTNTNDAIVRSVEKTESPRIAAVRDDMTSMSPSELRKAFRKTYLSENKHLSTYQIDDRFDVASDVSSSIEGFTARRDLSEGTGVRPLEIKISFRGDDSALSRENYNLLTEYAGIVVNNPKRAIQVAIPGRVTTSGDARKLAARRLAIVEQVLRDTGVSEQRIMPVLSQRDDDGFVLRIISNDQYETLSKQKRDMFGDTVNKKTYTSLAW
ncbi:hypothetical protein HDR66_01850 [bacterium]|nr:hypothetical protein [bacterium]